MSRYGPCEICGEYTSVGVTDDMLCRRCSKDDEPYYPDDNLHDYAREQNQTDINGTAVRHRHYGLGTVEYYSNTGEIRVDFEDGRSETVLINEQHLAIEE